MGLGKHERNSERGRGLPKGREGERKEEGRE